MAAPVRESSDEIGVDRSHCNLAGNDTGPCGWLMLTDPSQFGGRKVRIEPKASTRTNQVFVAGIPS